MFNPILFSLLLSALALPVFSTPANIFQRQACNADNCLRALDNPTDSVDASTFCSTYLAISTATTHVTQITTPPTVTTTVNVAGSTITIISSITITSSISSSEKQAVATTSAYPSYLSLCTVGSTIAAGRVSSACSCFITADTSTTTLTETVTSGTAPTITKTITAAPTTVTTVITVTFTATSPTQTSTSSSAGPFTVIASLANTPIESQAVNAANGSFYIGEAPSTFCPVGETACPAGTTTTLLLDNGSASLDVEVPAGQAIYVAATGALSFAAAHDATFPPGALITGFKYTPGSGSDYGTFAFDDSFMACPVTDGGDIYQVFVEISTISNTDVPAGNVNQCLIFQALTLPASGPGAYQYE